VAFVTNRPAVPDQTPWSIIQLKRRARELARSLGHSLERFRHFQDEGLTGRRPDYWFTYCVSCTWPVAVSPCRWGTHTIGGRGTRDECPNPAPSFESEDIDDV